MSGNGSFVPLTLANEHREYAAMYQLGASARGPFAEVVLLQQQGVVAAARRVDGDADAGGAAADDDHVPRLVALVEARNHVGTKHVCLYH